MLFMKRKYPVIRQYDQIDCGPAALLSVLKYYGGNSTIVYIRELSNTSVNGSTMLNLVNAAKKIGFDAFGAYGEYDELLKEKMPCIAHVVIENQLQHFFVVYKISDKDVLIGDPAIGLYKLKREQFNSIWKNKAVILLKPNDKLINHQCPSWIQWLSGYLKKEINWIYQTIFLGIVYTLIGVTTSLFIQKIIDQYIPENNIRKLLFTGTFLFLLVLIRIIAGYFRERFLVTLNKNINLHINADFIEHLFKLPKRFFDTRKIGDITSRINDAMKIQQAILYFIGTTIIDGFIIIASIALVFYFSAILGYLSLFLVPTYCLLLINGIKKIKHEQYDVMNGYAVVESTYIDSIRGIDEIIGYSTANSFSLLNKNIFKVFQEKVQKLGLNQARLGCMAEITSSLIIISVLIFGSYQVILGKFMIGEMMASYALIANIVPSINRMVYASITFQGASVASMRLMDLFLVEKEINAGSNLFHLENAIQIIDGSFSWNRRDDLFSNINMIIPRGRITALWGSSGSGKSTIVNLLQRKYELDNGEIVVDKKNISDIELDFYRKNIGVVPQQIKIFNASLLENILLGRAINTIADVEKRIQDIGFTFFLHRFGQAGLMTKLGEDGRHISGGELQIISIIRALYDNPKILIIDEGLNGVDIEIENAIFDIIKKYSKNNAVFLITHNLNTLLKSDYLYLLSHRNIVQEGNPIELIFKEGLFKNLVRIKFDNHQVYSHV